MKKIEKIPTKELEESLRTLDRLKKEFSSGMDYKNLLKSYYGRQFTISPDQPVYTLSEMPEGTMAKVSWIERGQEKWLPYEFESVYNSIFLSELWEFLP